VVLINYLNDARLVSGSHELVAITGGFRKKTMLDKWLEAKVNSETKALE
jgi:hypothetical protein